MKKLTAFLLSLVLLWAILPTAVYTITPIDPTRPSSLTLQYAHNQTPFAGLTVSSYRVAEVAPDGTYTLTGDFAGYPVRIYAVTSQAEWRKIASTLAAYARADRLTPTCSGLTDQNGTVSFGDILPGMYLTLSVTVDRAGEITEFENFLTVVPHPAEDGCHNYDVTAYPKCSSRNPDGRETEFKAVKLWKDSGFAASRPESVTVDILKEGVLQTSQTLSPANNWSFRWTAPDDGSRWQVVEREVPAGYTVTVTAEGNTFVLTNAIESDVPPAPPTGQPPALWLLQLALGLSGGTLLVLAAWRKRAE